MSRLGIFVDRKTLSNSEQLNALIRCRDVAEHLGHSVEFIFPVDICKIEKVDALFIRARTDPMNITYVAARMAGFHGIPVIDDPRSIQICSDKINMYSHLIRGHVSIPKTVFLSRNDLTIEHVAHLFDRRVGVLDGKLLYACKYTIPSVTFKIQASVNGHLVYCGVESVPPDHVPPHVIQLGIDAANAIGRGLYGVDIKNNNGDACVIEVNDNPSLESGEDTCYPFVYHTLVTHLLRK
jgi:glutathione synthase/RimK-type ligase-like ATP-grasp enzyme